VNVGNRRVKKPSLPPEVLEAGGIADIDPLEDAPPPSEPARTIAPEKKRPRATGIVRGILGVVLVIGISSVVAWAARKHVLASSRFAVKDVDVIGVHHRTNDEVIADTGIKVGANIFTVDLDEARAKLLADPWIADASLVRKLPGTITVQVTEREAGALVALGDLFVATRDGDVFKKVEPGDPAELPIITGMRPESVGEDREGAKRTIRRAIDLAADYEHSSVAKRATLQEIHVEPNGAITLIVGKALLALELGEPPFRKKLEEAARVMSELDKRGAKADVVMLDNEARPDRVVVRVR
jgi:cell division protein FtsQ